MMAINRFRYYLGPLGALQPLPPLPQDQDPEVGLTLSGAEFQSLTGRRTLHLSGRGRRAWRFSWNKLTEDEELFIQAALRRTAAATLRYMDPRKRNLLPEDVSVGGSATLSTSAFVDVGAATPVFLLADVPTVFSGVLAGGINWPSVTNGQQLWGTTEQLPIVAGSSYRFSAYVKGSTTFKLGARPFNTAGVEQANVLDGTTNTATGAWTRFSWDYTPAGGLGSVYFGINANGSGNLQTTGWMVQVDEALANWTFGYGCPEVYVQPQMQGGQWRLKYHKATIMVVEV